MNWIEVITILGTMLAALGFMTGFMFYMFNRLDGDMKTLGNRMESQNVATTKRIDQLYTMFIDLLKERK